MLQTTLIHPTILRVLGESGHGSKILIADGNYPFVTHTHPAATRVFLNLRPGLVNATNILEALVEAVPIEAAAVMQPSEGPEPLIFTEFRTLLPEHTLATVDRFAFYELARQPELALVIASGEQRIFANILLTIGVVLPPDSGREEEKGAVQL